MARTNWGAVVALALAIVPMALDMSILAVALPAIGADLDAAPSVMQWVVLAYLLPVVFLSIPAGRWIDRAGCRPVFLLAVAGFGATSVLIAVSTTLSTMLIFRTLQGIFGAVINGMAYRVIASLTLLEHRGRAMSIVVTLIPLGMIAGPGVGGLMVEAFGWRSIFLINIPIVMITLWQGYRTLPDEGRLVWPDRRMLDMRPVIALVRRPAVAGPLTSLMLVVTGVAAPFFLVPYYLSEVLQESARVSGSVILTLAAGTAIVSPLGGWLADRFGARQIALVGTVMSVAGMASLVSPLGPGSGPLDIAWRLAVIGAGHGLFSGPVQVTLLAAVPREMTATAGGVAALFRTSGFAIGPVIAATAWTLASGGSAGFRAGVLALTMVTALGIPALLLARGRTSTGVPAEPDDGVTTR